MKLAKVITIQAPINKKHDALIIATVSPNATAESFLAQFGKKTFKHYEETSVMPLPFALALAAKKRRENRIA